MAFFLAVVSNGLIGFFKRNNLVIPFLGFMILAWIAGTMVSGQSFDTDAYELLYPLSPTSHRFEQGYMQMSYLAYTSGIPYGTFRLWYFIVGFTILFIGVSRFTKNRSLYVFLFSLFPFLNEASQVRNFMMFAWVLLGMSFLINKSKWNTVLAIVFITIGFLFQTTGIVFYFCVILRYIPFNRLRKIVKFIFPCSLVLATLFYVSGSSSFVAHMLKIVTSISNRQDITEILAANDFGNRNITQTIGVVLTYLIAYWLFDFMIKSTEKEYNLSNKLHVLYLIVIIGIVFIPLMFVSFNFERILRNSIDAVILGFTVYFSERKKTPQNISILLIFVVVLFGMVSKGFFINEPGKMGNYVPYILHLK